MKIFDVTKQILKEFKQGLTTKEIYNIAMERNLLENTLNGGVISWRIFSVKLYKNARIENSIFEVTKQEPKKFYLKAYKNEFIAENYMTIFDITKKILQEYKIPLSQNEIYNIADKKGWIAKTNLKGKTPWQSFAARLYAELKNENSIFASTGINPMKFYLKAQKDEFNFENELQDLEMQKAGQNLSSFHERELHPLLVKFVNINPNFDLFCKTIFHEKSQKTKKGQDKWLYPDMVGIHFPYGDYENNVLKTISKIAQIPAKLYSFELKKDISPSNIREYYFQAVSNSSWANEGYLVGLNIDEKDEELIMLINKLNLSFGIGVISLNSTEIAQSQILAASKTKELDLITMNDLCSKNPNFKDFLSTIAEFIDNENSSSKHKKIIKNDLIHKFDEILDDEQIENHLKKHNI